MLVKRDPIAYANVWWAQRIAPALGSRRKIWVLLAEGRVDTSACSKAAAEFCGETLESKDVQVTSRDAVIVVAPGVTQSWTIGYDLARNAGAPVVFLNSQLSERYSLGGPLDDVEEVYYLKPISKGFVYRAYPGGWQCILGQTGWSGAHFTKSFHGDDAAVLAPSSGEEPASTPSSRCRVDGVEVDATMQHERAVKFDFHVGASSTSPTARRKNKYASGERPTLGVVPADGACPKKRRRGDERQVHERP